MPLPARMQDQTTQKHLARAYLASTTPSSVVIFQVTGRLLLCTCSKCQKPANQKEESEDSRRVAGQQTRGSQSSPSEIRKARSFARTHRAFRDFFEFKQSPYVCFSVRNASFRIFVRYGIISAVLLHPSHLQNLIDYPFDGYQKQGYSLWAAQRSGC